MKNILFAVFAIMLIAGCKTKTEKQTQNTTPNLGDNRICTFAIKDVESVVIRMHDGKELVLKSWAAPASVLYVADNVGICYLMGVSYENAMDGSK